MGIRKVYIKSGVQTLYFDYPSDKHNEYERVMESDEWKGIDQMCKSVYLGAYPGDRIKVIISGDLARRKKVREKILLKLLNNPRFVDLKNLSWDVQNES